MGGLCTLLVLPQAFGKTRLHETVVFEAGSIVSAHYEKRPIVTLGFALSVCRWFQPWIGLEMGIGYTPKQMWLDGQRIQFAVVQIPVLVRLSVWEPFSFALGGFVARRLGQVRPAVAPFSAWRQNDAGITVVGSFDYSVFEMLYIVSEMRLNAGILNQNQPSLSDDNSRLTSLDLQLQIGVGYDFF